ncbi:hypothetical protein ACFL04_00230 [Patescibacteria group bacterium]
MRRKKVNTADKIIGLDFGGVIANHLPVKRDLLQRLFHKQIDTDREATRAALLSQMGQAAYERLITELSKLALEFPLHRGTKEALLQLSGQGCRLVVVSTQQVALTSDLQQYFHQHGLPIDNEDVHVVRHDKQKPDTIQRLRLPIYCDDNQTVLRSLKALDIPLVWANFNSLPVDGSDGLYVMESWKDLVKALPFILSD